jgi:hypothetical protein
MKLPARNRAAAGADNRVTVGILAGSEPVKVDLTSDRLFPVTVKLLADYEMLDTAEFPRPSFLASRIAEYPHVARKGVVIRVARCEALALVAAGAGEIV